MNRQFLKFVLPSMLTSLLVGFYAMVDGFFVGRAVGDVGLAAINIAWPVTALIMALGTGIGTGGAVLMSLRRGEGDEAGERRNLAATLILLGGVSVAVTAILFLSYPRLLALLGAEGEVLEAGKQYVRCIVLGCALQIFGSGLTPLIRNRRMTVQAMLIMVAGLVTNIVLDYLLVMVFPLELFGAALATILAQGLTAVLGALLLFLPKTGRLAGRDLRGGVACFGRILLTGLSPFGISLMPSVIIMLNNWQCLRYGGTPAAAAYAVLSYVFSTAQLLLSGVGDGIQPLVSEYTGGKNSAALKGLKLRALILVAAFSVVLTAAGISLRGVFPKLFGTGGEASAMVERAMLFYSACFPLVGYVRLNSAYFYARGKGWASNLLVYLDPALISPLLLYTLPLGLGLDGIWLSLPLAQATLALLALALNLVKTKRRTDSL